MVKITKSTRFDGLSNMDYAIDVNGIRISLEKETFEELVEKISESLKEDYAKVVKAKKKYDERIDMVQAFRKELISIFWDRDQEGFDSLFFKRELNEIDQEKLWNVLEANNKFFGFQ